MERSGAAPRRAVCEWPGRAVPAGRGGGGLGGRSGGVGVGGGTRAPDAVRLRGRSGAGRGQTARPCERGFLASPHTGPRGGGNAGGPAAP